MKIIFTGGHHNSSLLLAELLKQEGEEIYWFGHKYSILGNKSPSAEYLEVTGKNIPFFEINAGKWQPNYKFLQNILRIPVGFFQSFFLLLKIKPQLVVSFGGYLAIPVAYSAFVLGIPVVTHEQTTVSGLANKLISKVAKKVFISFESSSKFFPKEKVILTGLPLRKEIFAKTKKLFNNSLKTIYITGGKQGAHVLNKAVFANLSELLEKFNVIHQCGSATAYKDIDEARRLKESLGEKGINYLPKEYFFENEIGQVYYSSDFVISRAGAHTVYELLALKKPAILIPIPNSSGHEQESNALMFKETGLGEILSQKDLERGMLLKVVQKFADSFEKYHLLPGIKEVNINAVEILKKEIETL